MSIISADGAEILTAFDADDSRAGIAGLLIGQVDAYTIVEILKKPELVASILSRPDPEAWLKQRFKFLARVQEVAGKESFNEKVCLLDLDEEKIDILEGVDNNILRAELIEPMIRRDDNKEEFQQRVDFWQELITPELEQVIAQEKLEYGVKRNLLILLKGRASFMRALEQLYDRDTIRRSLLDEQSLKSLRNTCVVTDGGLARITLQERASLGARETVEIEAPEELAEFREMVEDILEQSGMDEIVKQLVQTMYLIPPVKAKGAGGGYGLYSGMKIVARLETQERKQMPGTIIHETGHAVMQALIGVEQGQALFDEYVIQAVYQDRHQASAYPEAIALQGSREDSKYVGESFAEDFLVFLTQAELIPAQRRAIMHRIFHKVFPDIDLEELRGKIRQMYGNLFGVGIKDIQRPATHDAVEQFARKLDRIDAERVRDKKKEKTNN